MPSLRTRCGRTLSRTLAAATDVEHGTKHCLVPYSWREQALKHRLWPTYACSSFAFSAVGVLHIAALLAYPSKVLYRGEWLEGMMWIWQGFASWWCDVHDFGRPSVSHPVDRISAALLCTQQFIKYSIFFCRGHYWHLPFDPWARGLGVSGIVFGAYCFHRSSCAVREGSLRGFLAWHTAWHFVWPAAVTWFFVLFYVL